MDLNYVLLWFLAPACLLLLYRGWRARLAGWAGAALLVIAATGVAWALRPGACGYVGGVAFGVLVVLPLAGHRFVLKRMLQQKYGAARRMASLVRWLHPADGWLELPRFLRALESGQPATLDEAAELLSRRNAGRTTIGRLAIPLRYRLHNQWDEMRLWIEGELSPADRRHDPNLVVLYLRAFGELGDPNGLLQAFARLTRVTEGEGIALYRSLSRLMAFAFCGRKEAVERLFRGPLGLLPRPVQVFWLATADMALGDADAAREALKSIQGACDPLTAAGIERRLAQPLPVAEAVLLPAARSILTLAEAGLDQEERYGPRAFAFRRTAQATFVLIALNAAMFGLEMAFGGSTDHGALYRLGALWPSAVARGEWWRLVAALFLHYGAVHLFLNMLALLLLGPFLEGAVGRARYVLTYLLSGSGSMLAIAALAWSGRLGNEITVGASGAIMGIVGATVAVFLRGWMRDRARIASRRLAMLLFVIAYQVLFDLSTPQVSFTGHLSGAVIGFVVAFLACALPRVPHPREGKNPSYPPAGVKPAGRSV